MLTLHLRQGDLATLRYKKKCHESPRVRLRMNVLWLLSNGAGREEAAKYGEVSLSSAKNYIRAYNCGGLEEVERLGYKGSCGKLAPFHDKIKESFEDVPPRTCN